MTEPAPGAPAPESPDSSGAAPERSRAPGLFRFSIEGRQAPAIFVGGWLGTIVGTALALVGFLSGQGFAKLILAGWVPAGLVLGISIGSRHDDWMTVTQTRWGSGNSEVHGYTDLVNQTRHDARSQLEKDVARHGAAGVVVQEMTMRVRERECPMQEGRRDHIVEATIIGTSIAKFAQRDRPPAPPLAIMSLDPQRRQAARVRL